MFNVKIADVVITIDNKEDLTCRFYEEYKVTDTEQASFSVSVNEDEIKKELESPDCYSRGYAECLGVFRKICLNLINYNAFVMHSAVVSIDNEAYAFAAASGTGKTTHVRLWLKEFNDKCSVVNGDKPIMRFIDDVLYACGNPWKGKENLGENIMVPLKAVCFIERSPDNHIRKLNESEVIGRIFNQLLMPDDEQKLDKFMNLIDKMLSNISFYLLQCNMESEAAHISFEKMRGE